MLDYPIKYRFIEETLKAAVSYLYEHSDKSKTCQDKADELMDGINTYMMKDLIVIRNIYENPDLLKVVMNA
jgi:hypothetical protein